MYYIISLTIDNYDHTNKNGNYLNMQSYHEVWSIDTYQVARHSIPILDTLLYRSTNNTFLVSIVIKHTEYVDNPAASWNEAFTKGKSAILQSQDLPKKLYFSEEK
jgi:hypothetical protein